nr:hypothetical protein [Neisseria meningitidis]
MPEFHIYKDGKGAEAVVGWGLRPTTHKARAFATEHQLPFIAFAPLALNLQNWDAAASWLGLAFFVTGMIIFARRVLKAGR